MDSNVAIEVQIYSRNFKSKKSDEYICRYLFKLVGIYKIQNIQISSFFTPKKRQKMINKGIVILPRSKVTISILNLL